MLVQSQAMNSLSKWVNHLSPFLASPLPPRSSSSLGNRGDGLLRIQARESYADPMVHHPLIDWEPAEAHLDPQQPGERGGAGVRLGGWLAGSSSL